jgi:hypothetical protein
MSVIQLFFYSLLSRHLFTLPNIMMKVRFALLTIGLQDKEGICVEKLEIHKK